MRLILVGGFLGAGKTTLLSESARRLTARGHKVGLITNDQAPNLVDTALLAHTGAAVREVSGSCFCCNFEGFQAAAQSLIDAGAEYIVAEPVGSCTDLSATIVQPLKEKFVDYRVAPLSVLLDPDKARDILLSHNTLLHADAAYIFRLQLAEADLIVLSKADTLSASEREGILSLLVREFPHAQAMTLSSVTGEGIEPWLDHVSAEHEAGRTIATVDYDRYANGEAVLGWLNALVNLRWTEGIEPEWKVFVQSFFDDMKKSLEEASSEVGHVKLLLETADGRIAANLTGLHDAIQYRDEGALRRLTATFTVNARVQTSPDRLEFAFREALGAAAYARVAPTLRAFHCIKPGRPVPTFRYDKVVV